MIKAFDLETGFLERKQFELQTIWLEFEFPVYFPLYTRRRRDEKQFQNKVAGITSSNTRSEHRRLHPNSSLRHEANSVT
jgi:hypothetical protein